MSNVSDRAVLVNLSQSDEVQQRLDRKAIERADEALDAELGWQLIREMERREAEEREGVTA